MVRVRGAGGRSAGAGAWSRVQQAAGPNTPRNVLKIGLVLTWVPLPSGLTRRTGGCAGGAGGGAAIWPRFNLFLLRISTPFHGTGTTAVNINRFYCSLQGTVPALHCTYDPGRSPGELDCGRGARSRRGTGAYYPVRTWTSSARTTPWIPWVKARCIKVLLY